MPVMSSGAMVERIKVNDNREAELYKTKLTEVMAERDKFRQDAFRFEQTLKEEKNLLVSTLNSLKQQNAAYAEELRQKAEVINQLDGLISNLLAQAKEDATSSFSALQQLHTSFTTVQQQLSGVLEQTNQIEIMRKEDAHHFANVHAKVDSLIQSNINQRGESNKLNTKLKEQQDLITALYKEIDLLQNKLNPKKELQTRVVYLKD